MDPVLRNISMVIHGGEKVSTSGTGELEAAASLREKRRAGGRCFLAHGGQQRSWCSQELLLCPSGPRGSGVDAVPSGGDPACQDHLKVHKENLPCLQVLGCLSMQNWLSLPRSSRVLWFSKTRLTPPGSQRESPSGKALSPFSAPAAASALLGCRAALPLLSLPSTGGHCGKDRGRKVLPDAWLVSDQRGSGRRDPHRRG